MVKKSILLIGFLFLNFFLIGFISCEFSFNDSEYKIDSSYLEGESIRGKINLSFNNEPVNSVFSDSFGNTISLEDFFVNNSLPLSTYCIPQDCQPDYETSGTGVISKTFSLPNRESKLVGFNLRGCTVSSIKNVTFLIESSASDDCYNQLFIDIFDDGEIEMANTKADQNSICQPKVIGCFNGSRQDFFQISLIDDFCQKMTLPVAPGFRLGARIFGQGNYVDGLQMRLIGLSGSGSEGAVCTLPLISENTVQGRDIFCDVNYTLTEPTEFYVCISPILREDNFFIRGYEDTENGCGFVGEPAGQEETGAYDFFAYPRSYDSIGKLDITNTLLDGFYFNELVQSDLNLRYGNLNCNSHNCIVPIRIISKKDQNIVIRNLSVEYDCTIAPNQEETRFYDLVENSAVITTPEKRTFSLDNLGFSVPNTYGESQFTLSFSGQELLSETIVVENQPIIISRVIPAETAYGFPTTFEVIAASSTNISSYVWSFGNGGSKITDTNKAVYIYNSTGSYILRVTLIDSAGRNESYAYNLIVREPKQEIESNLAKKVSNLQKLKGQLNSFSSFEQELFNSYLNLTNLDYTLTELQREYASATSQSDYNRIISQLSFEIPESISLGRSAENVLFTSNQNEIDLEILKTFGGGDYYSRDLSRYLDSILIWSQRNVEAKLTFKEFFAKYDYSEKPFLRLFEFNIKRINDTYSDVYFIIYSEEELKFKENYGKKIESDYTAIKLDSDGKKIIFATDQEMDFINIPAFISPSLDYLVLETPVVDTEEEERISKWTLFLLIISLLILLGFTAYIILQVWYKRKYEDYLFKNRNNLFNLVTYVNHSKKKGMDDEAIVKSLKKAKWNSEQISYVMKKYSGKRTGMIEIPIDKIIKKISGNDNATQKNLQQKGQGQNFAMSKTSFQSGAIQKSSINPQKIVTNTKPSNNNFQNNQKKGDNVKPQNNSQPKSNPSAKTNFMSKNNPAFQNLQKNSNNLSAQTNVRPQNNQTTANNPGVQKKESDKTKGENNQEKVL